MHVHHFLRLKEEMESAVLLASQRKGHSDVDTNNEVAEVIRICREHNLHCFVESRDLGFHSSDSLAAEYIKLGFRGKIQDFLASSTRELRNLDNEIAFPADAADASTYMCAPMCYKNGQLMFPQVADAGR